MARKRTRFPVIIFILVLIFGVSFSIHFHGDKHSRVRRQACEEYTFEGRTCCKCGAGFKLKEHCSTRKDDQKCEPCEDRTYIPVPSRLQSCEPCNSCSQLGANLEEAVPCSRTNDTVCQCKENHYCISETHPCTECSPCEVCDPGVGVKVECSRTNNTICNKPQGLKVILLSIFIPLAVIGMFAALIYFLWRRRRACGCHDLVGVNVQRNGVNPPDEIVLEPLIGNVDLMPHIPSIATEIGWQDMRNIAMESNMNNGTIESLQQDYPNDSQERTIHLLRAWVEMEGGGASGKLIQCLVKNKKNLKAEKVKEILHNSISAPV